MKKIVIAGLLISSVISSSLFALELSQGKVLRHKEWTTGNIIKATYTTKANKFSKSLEDVQKNASKESYLSGVAVVQAQSGNAQELTTVDGYANAVIINNSKREKTYAYRLQTCIPAGEQVNCAIVEEMVLLEPNAYTLRSFNPSLQFVFQTPGIYPVSVSSSVNDFGVVNSSSIAMGEVTVH